MGGYTKKDAAKDTNSSKKDVSRAHHTARDDCQKSDNSYDKDLSQGWERKSGK